MAKEREKNKFPKSKKMKKKCKQYQQGKQKNPKLSVSKNLPILLFFRSIGIGIEPFLSEMIFLRRTILKGEESMTSQMFLRVSSIYARLQTVLLFGLEETTKASIRRNFYLYILSRSRSL